MVISDTLPAVSLAALESGEWTVDHPPRPANRITPAGEHFFFGYYDRRAVSRGGRYHLALRPGFMDRPNNAGDKAEIGLIDRHDGRHWTPLDDAPAWNWQMGACQQWLGTEPDCEFLYNAREGTRAFARIRNIRTNTVRDLPMPVYIASPDGHWGIGLNFARVHAQRPGYGYVGLDDPYGHLDAPEDDGLWRVDLRTGDTRFILSLSQVARHLRQRDMDGVPHWLNHVMISPNGERLLFLHRWRDVSSNRGARCHTRLYTCNPDGSDLFLLNRGPGVSHCDWRNDSEILSYCQNGAEEWHYHLMTDRSDRVARIGEDVFDYGEDGHCRFAPLADRRWLVTDTYPPRPHGRLAPRPDTL